MLYLLNKICYVNWYVWFQFVIYKYKYVYLVIGMLNFFIIYKFGDVRQKNIVKLYFKSFEKLF